MPGSPNTNDTSLAPKLRVRTENFLSTPLLSLDLEPFPSESEDDPSTSPSVLLPSTEDASSVASRADPQGAVPPSNTLLDDLPEAVRAAPTIDASPVQTVDFALRSAEINRRLFPARGLLGSLVVHGLAIFALIFFRPAFYTRPSDEPRTEWELTTISKAELYLPALGGGTTGGGAARGSTEAAKEAQNTAVPARSTAGVSYPGPQAIVSNPPHPTNKIQTILQPELVQPPTLRNFIPLPNMVKLAQPSPQPPAPDSIASSSAQTHPAPAVPLPVLPPSAVPPLQAPKLTLPVQASGVTNIPLQAMTRPPAPAAEPKPLKSKPQVLPSAGGRDFHSLLALSPMPAPPQPAPKIPVGEARGQFAIAALPNLAMTDVGPGSTGASMAPDTVGLGSHPDSSAHDATGSAGAKASAGARDAAAGAKSGSSPGNGEVTLSSRGEGTGVGIRTASETGSGPGTGSGSGSGAGAGPGKGAFPGITIQGGEWPSGQPSGLTAHQPAPVQQTGSYSLTIVSTGNSGGGLGDFGVFYNEPVFTVYIDVAPSPDDPAPPWTMEYAPLHASDVSSAGLAPPFPQKKEFPNWPADLADRYRKQLVVVFLVIDAEGQVQKVKTMQTPNLEFNGPLLSALENWRFRPATKNGTPIAVRALMGVPVVANRTMKITLQGQTAESH